VILIIGGLGYLGGRITEKLLQQNYEVRLATSNRLTKLPNDFSNCELVHFDLMNLDSLDVACENISTVIHLAGMNAKDCGENPEMALKINGLGTLNLIKSAIKQNVKRIIYFSTAHIYASPLAGEFTELSLPRPIHPYSITHRLAEDYVLEYSSKGLISGTVFRLSNAVGSPISQNANCWDLLVNDLAKQSIISKKLELHSAAHILRDFISIGDVCDVVLFVLGLSSNETKGIFNIGSGKATSLGDMASLIALRTEKLLGYMPVVNFHKKSSVQTDSCSFNFNVDKIGSIGFRSGNSIADEIDRLLLNCKIWYQ